MRRRNEIRVEGPGTATSRHCVRRVMQMFGDRRRFHFTKFEGPPAIMLIGFRQVQAHKQQQRGTPRDEDDGAGMSSSDAVQLRKSGAKKLQVQDQKDADEDLSSISSSFLGV